MGVKLTSTICKQKGHICSWKRDNPTKSWKMMVLPSILTHLLKFCMPGDLPVVTDSMQESCYAWQKYNFNPSWRSYCSSPLLQNVGVSATEQLSCSNLPTTGSVSLMSEAIPKYVHTYVHRYGVCISLGIRSWNLIARCYFIAMNTHQFSPNYSVLELWHIVFRTKMLIELILHFLKLVTCEPQLDSDEEAVCAGSFDY